MAKLKYKDENGFWQELPVGTNVVANPMLTGTEQELTSLQVGNTKYKSGGGKLYLHHVQISIPNIISNALSTIYINIYSNNTKYTKNTIPKTAYSATILSENGNGTIYLELSNTTANATGAICDINGNFVAFNSSRTTDSNWNVINDMVIDL